MFTEKVKINKIAQQQNEDQKQYLLQVYFIDLGFFLYALIFFISGGTRLQEKVNKVETLVHFN